MNCSKRRSLALLAVFAAGVPASASDWYVDAVAGSDANSGTSAASAWKTLTYALLSAPSGPQTIHLAPGVYDAANGEVFPLAPRSDFAVVGDAGSALTTVDAGGLAVDVFAFQTLAAGAGAFGAGTRIEGLALRGGSHGVRVDSKTANIALTLRDVDVSACATGFDLHAAPPATQYSLLENVRAHDCASGMVCTSSATSSTSFSITARDSSFSHCTLDGLHLVDGNCLLVCERTHLDDNGRHGAYSEITTAYASCKATFNDCSLSRNNGCGWTSGVINNGTSVARRLYFTRCTIARNASYGVLLYDDCFDNEDYAVLSDSIVAGNHGDLEVQDLGCELPTLDHCCIGDGSYLNGMGSFSGNPGFVDPGAGDFRLRWGSRCVDAGASTIPAGALDVAGGPRSVDGDLNTLEVADLGAFEFQPLELVGTGELGTLLQWKLWGTQGNASLLYWTRVGLASAPMSTSYGEFDLDPALASVYRVTIAGSPTPTVLQRPIPSGVLLVGHTFAFQALTDCAAAPSGKAYSNPVEITIVP